MRQSRLSVSLLAVVMMVFTTASFAGSPQTKTITFDHLHQLLTPTGPIALANRDTVIVEIKNTLSDCFVYPVTVNAPPRTQGLEANRRRFVTVRVPITHDGKAAGYTIKIDFKPGMSDGEKDRCRRAGLAPIDVDIPVDTLSWALGFAGAFTADTLTDPVYFLEPATGKVNGTDTPGFNVKRNSDAEDNVILGTAAMIHLYHTDPDRYSFLGGNLAPISFGLGVGADSKTKYLLGTSLRFDDHLYLTGGLAFGAVKRLPNALTLEKDHSFTTASNALDNLPSRNRVGVFFSVSYTFLGRNLRGPNGPFMTKFAQTDTPTQPVEDTGTTNATIELDPVSGTAGTTIKITPVTGDFGQSTVANSSVSIDGVVTKATVLGAKWKPAEIEVLIPADAQPKEIDIVVTKAGTEFGKTKFAITPPLPALTLNPTSGKVGTKITITAPGDVNFGGTSDDSRVEIGGSPIKSRDLAEKWGQTKITDVAIPQLQPGKTTVTVIVDDVPVASAPFEVKAQ